MEHDTIVIGASAGGISAVKRLISDLPPDLPAAVFIVIHTTATGPGLLPKVLEKVSRLKICEAADGGHVKRGCIYVAPPNKHLLLQDDMIHLGTGAKENRVRPAVDVLFRSAAVTAGPRVIGVILSGNLDDGAAGLAAIKACGGLAVVQDPEDADFPGMPTNALAGTNADYSVALAEMGPLLTRLVRDDVQAGGDSSSRPKIPRTVEVQNTMQLSGKSTMDEIEAIGSPSGLSCPECHGTLWVFRDGKVLRFRCHTGHAFSEQTLGAVQSEQHERALGSALRALEETAVLSRQIAERARQRSDSKLVDMFEKKAANAKRDARLVREILHRAAEEESDLRAKKADLSR